MKVTLLVFIIIASVFNIAHNIASSIKDDELREKLIQIECARYNQATGDFEIVNRRMPSFKD